MFDLNEQTVTFANFNARTELNGETRKPASDISCRAQLPNKVLDMFYPGLLGMLYERPKNPDLVEQGSAEGFTALRMPLLGLPLDWDLVLDNRTLTIHYGLGDDKSNLVLPECKVHKFKITPQIQDHASERRYRPGGLADQRAPGRQAGRLAVRPPDDRDRHQPRGGQGGGSAD